MTKVKEEEHRLLTLWAAECAEHVLYLFEKDHPGDDRPRKAIEAARDWVRGELKMTEARRFAFAAHASAREAKNPSAIAAAHAAGHAAATAHVASHAKYAASYALKASISTDSERVWQLQRLPECIKSMVEID
jgi:hypothetical protein